MTPPISLSGLDIEAIRTVCMNLGIRAWTKKNELARYQLDNGALVIVYKYSAVVAGTDAQRANETATLIRDAITNQTDLAKCQHRHKYGCAVCEEFACDHCDAGHAPDCAGGGNIR